nr:MAG TPA: Chromatin remodeling complex ATPase [Caudoviricetes sp.]
MWAPKTEPRWYQVQATKWLASKDGGLLFFDTRTGKTKTTIDYLSWLNCNRGVTHALVVCPPIAVKVWETELDTHWWGKQDWQDVVDILPYSKIARCMPKEYSKADYDKSALVADECHMLKTPSSNTSRRVLRMAKRFKYKVGLTATPVTQQRKVAEIYPQLVLVNPSTRERFPTAQSFREYFALWNGFKFLKLIHENEYNKLISDNAISMTREEAMGISGVDIVDHTVTMSDRVRDLYEALVSDDIESIEPYGWEPAQSALALYAVAVRAVEGVHQSYGVWDDYLIREVEPLLRERSHSIVCARHTASIDALVAELSQDFQVYRIDGRTKDKHEVARLWSEADTGVLVVHPKTVETAIDLRVGEQVVWFSPPISWSGYRQASDRIALHQGEHHPRVINLVVQNSIYEGVYETLRSGRDLHQALLDESRGIYHGNCV